MAERYRLMDSAGRCHGIESLREYMCKNTSIYDKLVESIYLEPSAEVAAEAQAEGEEVDIDAASEKAVDEALAEVSAKSKKGKKTKEEKKKVQELAEVSIDSVPGEAD